MSQPVFARSMLCALMLLTTSLAVAQQDAQTRARAEFEVASTLTPDLANGRQVYLICAVCHRPEGWGSPDGAYPQIAGQLPEVIVKQLADIRAGNRDNPLMYPFALPRILGGPQNIVDVAAYVARLPMTANNAKGPGTDLALGRTLYETQCAECHGADGEGSVEHLAPQLAGQHFPYLMRQFEAIASGRRRNSDPAMTKQLAGFSPREQMAVLDYSARLPLPVEKTAPVEWSNPDFPAYVREPLGVAPPPPPPPPPLPPR
ncbi:c-type cytochrome [Marichromatium bheemlicum]|uniref:C-type cytochrome n=1 Tax=Marichromatium bheemlicum TaxID=365339 RepID=A0ABX1I7M6_9GAMM|nr:c-type cytochrome [Marichromatium bheemlicum]NKN33568.1 c-type cytochrome [Marichromatium bheemlicum]